MSFTFEKLEPAAVGSFSSYMVGSVYSRDLKQSVKFLSLLI